MFIGRVGRCANTATVGEVDVRIRDQIAAGTYPIRLKADDWRSGDKHCVLDIIATDEASTTKVLANFGQLAKGGSLKLHPRVARTQSPEALEKMGAVRVMGEEVAPGTNDDGGN